MASCTRRLIFFISFCLCVQSFFAQSLVAQSLVAQSAFTKLPAKILFSYDHRIDEELANNFYLQLLQRLVELEVTDGHIENFGTRKIENSQKLLNLFHIRVDESYQLLVNLELEKAQIQLDSSFEFFKHNMSGRSHFKAYAHLLFLQGGLHFLKNEQEDSNRFFSHAKIILENDELHFTELPESLLLHYQATPKAQISSKSLDVLSTFDIDPQTSRIFINGQYIGLSEQLRTHHYNEEIIFIEAESPTHESRVVLFNDIRPHNKLVLTPRKKEIFKVLNQQEDLKAQQQYLRSLQHHSDAPIFVIHLMSVAQDVRVDVYQAEAPNHFIQKTFRPQQTQLGYNAANWMSEWILEHSFHSSDLADDINNIAHTTAKSSLTSILLWSTAGIALSTSIIAGAYAFSLWDTLRNEGQIFGDTSIRSQSDAATRNGRLLGSRLQTSVIIADVAALTAITSASVAYFLSTKGEVE
jgi:hypothetical protein